MIEPIAAYLDPRAGATILQVVLVSTVGIGALVRLRPQNTMTEFGRGHRPAQEPALDHGSLSP